MNRSFLAGAAAALALVGVQATALGQMTPTPAGVMVRAGIFLPVNSTASNSASAWFAAGAQYKFYDIPGSPGDQFASGLALSADFYSRGAWSQAPVLLNYVATQGQVFLSGGAGIGFGHEPTSTGIDFAYQAGVGYNFPSSGTTTVFLEAKWWGSDRTELDGFGLYAGLRF